jgi:hypothetical protein
VLSLIIDANNDGIDDTLQDDTDHQWNDDTPPFGTMIHSYDHQHHHDGWDTADGGHH